MESEAIKIYEKLISSKNVLRDATFTEDANIIKIKESKVTVILGDLHWSQNEKNLIDCKIRAIFNISNAPKNEYNKFKDISYYNYNDIMDEDTVNISKIFDNITYLLHRYIDDHKQNVYIHCRAGISRSATVLAAYLIKYKKIGTTEALLYIRMYRGILPNVGFIRQLLEFERICHK